MWGGLFVLSGMSELLPAKIERVWLVDQNGQAVENKPQRKLTSGQRHYMYRIGLMAVDAFMKERGFRQNAEGGSTCLSYEKGGVLIDIAVKKPDNIAFVTSHANYRYDPQVVGKTADGQKRYSVSATVTSAKDVLGADFLVQLMVSANDGGGTRNPIFIPLPKTLDNPARYVVHNVLGLLALACETIPRMRDAFSEQVVKEAQIRPINEVADESKLPQLPQ